MCFVQIINPFSTWQNFELYHYEAFWRGQYHCGKWDNMVLVTTSEEMIVSIWENVCYQNVFLAPLAVGQPAYVMVCCASVRLCINFFFKHLLVWNYLSDFDEILQKCSCHGPLQNFLKKLDSVKNSGCHGNKTENILKTLKIFLSETIRVRATNFGM